MTAPLIPYAFAKLHGVVALDEAQAVAVHFTPQCPPQALAEIRRISLKPLSLRPAKPQEFDQLLHSAYRSSGAASLRLIESMEDSLDLRAIAAALPEKDDVLSQDQEAPVIRMINALVMEALQQKASDIHIETSEKHVIVRFRVDGVLREVIRLKRSLSALLISRIKIMAKLDIAEKRLPQDGHIMLRSGGHEFDIRVSTIPGANAERVVLRLLDKEAEKLDLAALGMSERDLGVLSEIIHSPHGIVLVTGPTGSGKTTTLYAALTALNDGQRSILTIEDPIEVNLEGIGQTEVNAKVEMTFARGLRAILRQDPDIIMVGEIRDLETAEIAVQASLTGHLVFSTLHTNSAIGAITRLNDMRVESYLLASSLLGLVAQRLVRRLCQSCKKPLPMAEEEKAALGLEAGFGGMLYHPVGCEACRHTGYRGRIGIYEVIRMDSELKHLIHEQASEQLIEAHARKHNPSMMDDARAKILSGETSLEEVHRVLE